MIARGVRLLLVVDVTGTVQGSITARDIVGEKPVNLLHETRGKHGELTVADLMVRHDLDRCSRHRRGPACRGRPRDRHAEGSRAASMRSSSIAIR